MLLATPLERVFILKDKGQDIRLTDPEPRWSVEAVINFTPICTRYSQPQKYLHRRLRTMQLSTVSRA